MDILTLATNMSITDDLIVSPTYLWKEFRELNGGTIEDYKDYLIIHEDIIESTQEENTARVLNIPFDKPTYESWLKTRFIQDREIMESHATWAYNISQNPKQLRRLLKKHPILPKAPQQEKGIVGIYYAVLMLSITSPKVAAFTKDIPYKDLNRVLFELQEFCNFKKYKPISKVRCNGIQIFIGNSFVSPVELEKLEEHLYRSVVTLSGTQKQIIVIPQAHRIDQYLVKIIDEYDQILMPLALPIITSGASGETVFFESILKEHKHELEYVSEAILRMLYDNDITDETNNTVFIVNNRDIDSLIGSITKHMLTFSEEDITTNNGPEVFSNQHKKNKRKHLHRIK